MTKPAARVVVVESDWETLVIDVPPAQRSSLRAVLNHRCDLARDGWIARHLTKLFDERGLERIVASADTLILTDHAVANVVFALSASIEEARQAGIVGESQAAALLTSLATAGSKNQFFSAVTGFVVAGVRGK